MQVYSIASWPEGTHSMVGRLLPHPAPAHSRQPPSWQPSLLRLPPPDTVDVHVLLSGGAATIVRITMGAGHAVVHWGHRVTGDTGDRASK